MELEDFNSLLDFVKGQVKILIEKNKTYVNDNWKDSSEETLLNGLEEQLQKFKTVATKEYMKRRLLHMANYLFFMWYKLGC